MADILVIHDQAHLRQLLLDQVRAINHRALGAIDLHQARSSAASSTIEYAVVLMGVPKGERVSTAIHQVKAEWPTAQVIVVGQSHDLSEAAEAVRHGALEYVVAPVEQVKLTHALLSASERSAPLLDRVPHALDVSPEDFTPVDSAMQTLYARAERAAAVNSTVLITGESGTGKEVLARRIHRLSARRHAPFVPVNCGGLPETLVETELFGYKRGAFTGAVADSKGLIEEARGGVLFLDEIGDTPLSIQVRLLRFLDGGEVRAVGGTSIKHVDVRVIAATNRPLLSDIRERRFRDDLYFRLSVVSLHLPGLRERRADLAGLVQYHIPRVARKLRIPAPSVSDDAMTLLLRYDWPGNIRELQNALEQALIQDTDRLITPQDLPPSVQRGSMELITSATSGGEEQDQATLVSALRHHRGNRSEAAASLGISRTTLWRRLRQLNSTPT